MDRQRARARPAGGDGLSISSQARLPIWTTPDMHRELVAIHVLQACTEEHATAAALGEVEGRTEAVVR